MANLSRDVSGQVKVLAELGVTFSRTTEDEAAKFLRESTCLTHLLPFLFDFQTYGGRAKQGAPRERRFLRHPDVVPA